MSATPQVYLKPNVVIEPLFERWYAWPHLISPATAAMNITGRHLKIMESYLQSPQIHAAAVKNPKMRGGPFMDLGGMKKELVRKLLDNTLERQQDMIELSDAIRELDKMLKDNAHGYSLECLYQKVPDCLRGFVELVYDLNGNPAFRIFESLLYKSKYYNTDFQSFALWMTNNDERHFCLSTPRVDDNNIIHIEVPFADPAIDMLSSMKRKAGSLEEISCALKINPEDEPLFNTLFTTEPPPPYKKYDSDKIRMRYFGHACILVETNEVSILLDPVISYYGYQTELNRFSDIDLPDNIDYVLITHNHHDHILLETLLPLRHKIKNLVIPGPSNRSLQDPGLKLMFQHLGFNNIIVIDEMESLKCADCVITGIPFIGEHCDLDIQSKRCYHIKASDFTMLFLADSCNMESRLYEYIQEAKGKPDVLFLGMECDGAPLSWLYGPLLTEDMAGDKDSSRRLAGSNFEKSRALVDIFTPKEVYVYAMGQEPWLEFMRSIKYTDESSSIIASNKLLQYCEEKNITAERLFGEKELLYSKVKKREFNIASVS